MATKKHKPTSPGRRNMTVINYRDELTARTPHKKLTKGFRRRSGRNNQGRITTRHKGGGHKRKFRQIDFTYNKKDVPAKIESIVFETPFCSKCTENV